MVKLLCLCVMACAIVALVTARPPIYPVAMELASKTIQHTQMDLSHVLGYIFQLQDALKAYLTEPEDKNSLDQCLVLIEKFKNEMRRWPNDMIIMTNNQLIELNRILTKFAEKHPPKKSTQYTLYAAGLNVSFRTFFYCLLLSTMREHDF